MDTRLIESMIAKLCAQDGVEPELRELLEAVAERHGAAASAEELDRSARFVSAYVRQVPYMIKMAWTAATHVGLELAMERILSMVQSYWVEGDDIIPDELGVIGLLDDAYCSLTSLQAVSEHYQLQTGKHLFPDDLSAANAAMRRIIGEPYASELDRIVIRTMRQAGLIDATKRLASEEKQISFSANSTIWNHGPAGRLSIEDLRPLGVTED